MPKNSQVFKKLVLFPILTFFFNTTKEKVNCQNVFNF